MSRTLAQDLSRHLQQQIGEVIARNARIARKAIEPGDIYIMMIEAAVSTTLSAAASVASNADTAEAQAAAYDRTMTAIAAFVASDRERSLQAIAAGKAVPL